MLQIKINKRVSTILWFVAFAFFVGCNQGGGHGSSEDGNGYTRIDQKLETQFALYDQAREKILERVVEEGGAVERDEWEEWLTPAAEDTLSEDDLEKITERQQQIIAQSRADAIAATAFDLDLIRKSEIRLTQYCTELPKGALLHIHPSGTRNRQTVKEILEEVNPLINGPEIVAAANEGTYSILYDEEVEFLTGLPVQNYLDYSEEDKNSIVDFFFLPENPPTHDFKRFEAIFTINDLLDQNESKEEWVEEKTYLDFLKRCAKQNVLYVEFTSVMWPDEATFKQLGTWAEQWYAQTGIIVRWNSAFVRTLDAETNSQWAQELIAVLSNNTYPELVGIDLLANETDTPALETGQQIYIPVLAAVNAGTINLHRTMHAGELGFVHNVRDAMIMGAERVGHGVLLAQDPVALEYARLERVLPIEINIYSNYRLQVNEDFSQHPFLDYLRLGLPVSLSTDDEGMFITDITNEFRIAIKYTDITHAEVKQMAYNGLETAFSDEMLKTELIEKLTAEFAAFESQWSDVFAYPN